MSRSRKTLFFIGILIILSLSVIGSYFAIVTLARFDDDLLANENNLKLTYSFNIQSMENNGKPYGSCMVTKKGELQAEHVEEIDFVYDDQTRKFIPNVIIRNPDGEDVTNTYKLTIAKKYAEVDNVDLYIQPPRSIEYAGVYSDAYIDTASLKENCYLLGDCFIQAEMDTTTYNTHTRIAQFSVRVVDSENQPLNFFNLDNPTYSTHLRSRVVKLEVFWKENEGYPYYELVEGSFLDEHRVDLRYSGHDGFAKIRVYDERDVEVSFLYNIIITKYN